MQQAHRVNSIRTTVGIALIAIIIGACGASSNGDASSDSDTQETVATSSAEEAPTETAAPESDATEPPTDDNMCPATPFDGTVERADDSDGPGHTAGTWTGADFTETDVAAFGENNFTIYLSDQPIEGFTVVAPAGGVVVTIFLTGGDNALEPGTTLIADEERNDFLVIIDNSGTATSSSAAGGSGTLEVISAAASEVCFDIDYADNFRTISGTVSAARN